MEELDNVFEDILNMIMERDNIFSGARNKSKVEIENLMENTFDNDKILQIEKFYDAHKNSESVCEECKFYEHYWKIVSLMMNKTNSKASITNPYYAFKFVMYLLKTYLSRIRSMYNGKIGNKECYWSTVCNKEKVYRLFGTTTTEDGQKYHYGRERKVSEEWETVHNEKATCYISS